MSKKCPDSSLIFVALMVSPQGGQTRHPDPDTSGISPLPRPAGAGLEQGSDFG